MVDLSGLFSMVLHGRVRKQFSIGVVKGSQEIVSRTCCMRKFVPEEMTSENLQELIRILLFNMFNKWQKK